MQLIFNLISIAALIGLSACNPSEIVSDTYPANPNLMPSIGNGNIGYVIDSDSIYMAGVYCHVNHVMIYQGAERCRLPVP